LEAEGGKGIVIAVHGVHPSHMEKQLGGLDPKRILASFVDDTKLSPISLSTLSYDKVKYNYRG